MTKAPKGIPAVSVDTATTLDYIPLKDMASQLVHMLLNYGKDNPGKVLSLNAFYALWSTEHPKACIGGKPVTAKGEPAGLQAIKVIFRTHLNKIEKTALDAQIESEAEISTVFEGLRKLMPKLVRVDTEKTREAYNQLRDILG